ncbi:hypothetical protein [Bradyrhizobium australafricanum]|uniref:hypothetical protein n=1 Tax=Bradyrhizobium australafricanum TaxID=2821406 RepID=UPI001CE2ED9C|nr:hypothetical protein [Bradyrhizobium australafricanum]MCA6105499.1 hypothetical protein [Bradyrhizobium australafricanum]
MLAQRLDDGWDIEVGVTEEILGFATASWRSEQRTGLIVATMQQDGALPRPNCYRMLSRCLT